MPKSKAKSKHPFLYYGHEPGDWGEGPQLWLVRFVEPPDEETRGKLGEVAADQLNGKQLAIESMEFAEEGPWAAMISEESEEEPFALAATLFRAVHELAPIAEVIVATAREPGYSSWDRWSEKQQALPSVVRGVLQPSGDEQVRIDTHFRTRGTDDDYPARCDAEAAIPVRPSAAFDGAYTARRESLFRAELEQALAKATKSGKPALVPMAPGAVSMPTLPPELEEKIGPHQAFGRTPGGGVVAVAPLNWPHHLAVLEPGAGEVRRIEVKQSLPIKYLALAPGGGHVLVAEKRDLIEIDLATGEQQVVFQLPGQGPTALSADYLDTDDRVLAHLEGESACLLVRGDGSQELTPTSSVEVKGVNLVTIQRRFGFLADDRTVRVVGVHGDEIAALGAVPIRLNANVFETEHDGETGVFVLVYQENRVFKIFNLEAAYDKKLKKKKKGKKKG